VNGGGLMPAPLRRSVTLPAEPASAGKARRLVREVLTAAHRAGWVDAAEMACSEIVTNCVLHAHTDIEVTAEVTGEQLRVAVRDFNPALPIQRNYDEHATTGRGMALVAALSSTHGIEHLGAAGKSVWFTIDAAAPEAGEGELLAAWGADAWDLNDAAAPGVQAAGTTIMVRLLSLPPTLWLAARQHHDALLRELVLHLAGHDEPAVNVTATDEARSTISEAVIAAVGRAQRAGATQPSLPADAALPLPAVTGPLDLELHVQSDSGAAFGAMQDTLDAAERLARAGRLLTRPGLPEIIAVRDWACEQITAQLSGVAASPWPGTDQERFTVEVNSVHDERDLSGWDIGQVRDSERGVVAADQANRIIAASRPLAAALGWDVDDLVGRRVVTLIPQHLREMHVAGFTRHLTTGEAHVLDNPLTVPVLRADGSELQATLLVQRAPIKSGRGVYLAWIEPL
jgi:PAS domain S-box-containing protein